MKRIVLLLILLLAIPANVLALSPEQKKIYDLNIGYFDIEESLRAALCVGSTNLIGSTNAEKVYNYLTAKGFTPQQASGILGNFEVESPGIITDQEQVGGSAYGIAQWDDGRKTNLFKFAADNRRDVKALDTQLDFMWHEMNSSEKAAYEDLKKQTTVRDSTISFVTKYERAGKPNTALRIQHAEAFFAQYGSGATPTPSSGTTTCGGSGEVVGGFSLPVDRRHYDEHPEYFTKPHHSAPPAADIPLPIGTNVYSMSGGIVRQAPVGGNCGIGIIIDAGNGVEFIYCHGSDGGAVPGAKKGDTVAAGQLIMHSASTGRSDGPHLHLEIELNGQERCPQPFLEGIAKGTPPDINSLPTSGCTN